MTINGDDGKDNIQSYGKSTSIVGGKGNDFLEVWTGASDATIKAGAGDDEILLSGGVSASVNGGEGNDSFSIWLSSKNATVYGGSGNDSFEIGDESLLAHGDDDNDTFYATSGKNSTLYGDTGNDFIYLRDTKTKFFGGTGDDTVSIQSEAVNPTVSGGGDSDTFIINLSTHNGQSRTGNSAIIQDYESGKDKIVLEETSVDSYSIDGSDVILTLKSENISDYKLTLKNAKGKEITFTDSDGNTTKQTYTDDDNSEEVSFISYDQFTPEGLQQLQEKSIKSFNDLISSFNATEVVLTSQDFNNNNEFWNKAKNWTKTAKIIARIMNQEDSNFKFDNIFSILADINDIIVEVQDNLLDSRKSFEEKIASSTRVASKISNSIEEITKFTDKFKDSGFLFISSILGFAANIIAPMENMKDQRQKIERDFVTMIGEGLKFFGKKIAQEMIEYAATQASATVALEHLLGKATYNQILNVTPGLAGEIAGGIVAEQTKAALTARLNSFMSPFGPANVFIAAATGVVIGIDQLIESNNQYVEDKVPKSALNALLDSVATGMYEGYHKLLWTGDEALVQLGVWIGSKLTGNEPVNISEIDNGNYIATMMRSIKFYYLNELHGTDSGDIIISKKNKELIYGGYGNDHITNSHFNVSIFGGADSDTIISGTHNNYIDSGRDNDSISMHDNNSTVHGGNDKDTILIIGNNSDNRIIGNEIYGDSDDDYIQLRNADKNSINGDTGNDQILLQNSNSNTIRGGSGDDHIELQDSNNNTIVYRIGDGEDVIVGYNESDTIKFTRVIESEFSTIESETSNDIILKVGDKQIILKDAKGKKLNIESNFIPSIEDIRQKLFEVNPIIMQQNGNLNLRLRSSESPQAVSLGNGSQTVQFNDADGNIAVVDENATGRKNIIFGKGDDLGVFTGSNANIKVTVGSGYDSIVVDNNARINVDMAKASDAIIIANNSKVTLTNYDASSNAGILVSDVEDITNAVKNNSIQLINDEVQLDSSTSVKISDNSKDYTIVNLITDDGDIQKVGFTGINGGSLDSSKLNGDFLLKGNYAEFSSDKQGSHGSNIVASKGNDTIIAGTRDTVNGGSGHNQILLTPHNLRENKSGATIVLADKGRNTVQGFHAGFDSDSDCIKVDTISDIEFDFKNDGLILTSNDSRLLFDGIGTTESEEHEKISLLEGDSTVDAAIAQTNQSISVNDDTVPDAFFGNRSALNFNDYNGDININLAKEKGTIDGTDSIIKGFNKLQAGDGRNTLIGSNSNETLIAGNGYTSIWGGAGNDKLFGKSDSENKDGFTTFFFNSGDDHDTIADFEFITQDNRDDGTADKIDIANNVVTDVYRFGSDVVLQINDSSDYLTIKDAFGKDFQINNLIAKVDRNIAYDGLANYYVADGGSSLTVDSSVDNAEIWLDNSHCTIFIGNIRTLDASAVEGETSLVGNANDNTIIAGKSDASLWGGFSPADDLLIGGNSHNTFFYCNGNGHDTIQGTNNGDSVILSDISLNQITRTKITADAVSIDFIDGGSLQINGSSDITYQLADGSKYSANHERLEWDSK